MSLMSFLTLLSLALIPVGICLLYIYNKDRYEKEPKRFIFLLFVLGCISVIPAIFLESFVNVETKGADPKITFLYAMFGVAIIEEGVKLFFLWIGIWKNRFFNDRFDGVVYAVSVSLGFASLENILYVFQNGTSVGILRALTAIPGHTLFAVYMGYFFGLARFEMGKKKVRLVFLSLAVATLIHGGYDFLLMTGESKNPNLVFLFIPFFIVSLIIGFKLLNKLLKIDERSLGIVLPQLNESPFGGFFQRLIGFIIDFLILVTGAAFFYYLFVNDPRFESLNVFIQLLILAFPLIIYWLYFVMFESSKLQATIGKLAMGLAVIDCNGYRITFKKANARFFSKILSTLIIFIGFIMIVFSDKKQGLHDRIACTFVVKRRQNKE